MSVDFSMSALKAQAGRIAPAKPGLSVIVPAYNAAHYLRRALPPLQKMLQDGEILELIVVDDRSTDDTPAVAASFGARVIFMPKNMGPGAARNYAALEAKGEVLWFVDADVIAKPGSGALIAQVMAEHGVDGVFGSYDETPPASGFFSQYKNLVHRYYHQRGANEATTFWAGCGAVKRDVFLKVGGFDIERFKRPSIEDIELGYRITDAGWRIRLEPTLTATHLKVWTLKGVVHTDIFCRALPWSRLMLARGSVGDDLNVSNAERARAVLAAAFFATLAAPVVSLSLWPAPVAALLAVMIANLGFLRFMTRLRGSVFGLACLLFHQVYYVYSAASFSYCALEMRLKGPGRRPPPPVSGDQSPKLAA